MSKPIKFEVGVTDALSNIIAKYREHESPARFEAFYEGLGFRLHDAVDSLQRYPEGPTRARLAHLKIDQGIEREKKRGGHLSQASCFSCTMSGCCHTQVDITMEEAELLVETALAENIEINEDLFVTQTLLTGNDVSAIDRGHIEERASEWGKLSFEQRRCIFLSPEGKCRVYKDRPMVCRKWFVLEDPKSCDDFDGDGMISAVPEAEIWASAFFTISTSGRLPHMVHQTIIKKDNESR